ncbi:MAG: hypothetical protein HRT42_01375 [Campylobacteraceae bacterium]|nr:hypothetical protein [Campylobacteraceae bacterium]
MILLLFFAPFFIAIGVLVMIDNANTQEIDNLFKKSKCEKVFYYKSRYKSICENNIILVQNQFSVDFSTNIYIKYQNILNTKIDNTNLEIRTKKELFTLSFEKKEELNEFVKNLEDKQ